MVRAPFTTALVLTVAVSACGAARAASDALGAIPPALELPAGGVVFAARDRLVVDQEALTIALDRIEIDYLLRSTAERPHVVAMAFPLPVIDMANLYGADLAIPSFDPANPTNFVGFWTKLDDAAIEPDVVQRAYAIGHVDVTADLQKHALPLYPLDPTLAEKLAVLPAEAKRDLEEAGLIALDTGTPVPQWSLRTVFHWRYMLAPDAAVAMRHNYKPVAGSAPWSDEIKAKASAKYCLSDAQAAALDQRAATGKPPTVYWVHYVPGNNSWHKGASRKHTLTIERPDGDGIATTCTTGPRVAGERGFSIVAADRVDDVDIDVMFVE